MAKQCVIIESDLNLHRDALVGALRQLRPHLQTLAMYVDDVTDICDCVDPLLVICSEKRLIEHLRPFAWIMLFPDEEDVVRVGIGNSMKTLVSATMDDLLTVIDQVLPGPLSTPSS